MAGLFPSSPFWDFSLALYAKPGVAGACLALQARRGIDVNVLLFCLWRGMEGDALSQAEIAAAVERVRALHEGVVRPLRTARTALKTLIDTVPPELRPALARLRAGIKRGELDAEHAEQLLLAGLRPLPPPGAAGAAPAALARANAEAYVALLGGGPGPAEAHDLDQITAALLT